MSLITIPKEELVQLETAIKEKDRIIAEQKNYLVVMEGYRLYYSVLFEQSQALYLYSLRQLTLMLSFPSGTPDEAARLARLTDIDKLALTHGDVVKQAIAAWHAYLRDHPQIQKILNLQVPDIPVTPTGAV
jgi:hypothetical protein